MSTTWNEIKEAGGLTALNAFNKVWYERVDLHPDEKEAMRALYARFPLDEKNFKAWLKQRTSQLYENAVKAEMEAH